MVLMALDEGATVQPHYIVSDKRGGLQNELDAMEAIRGQIEQTLGPSVYARLLPTIFFNHNDITVDDDVTASLEMIRDRGRIGSQYAWLIAYARSLPDTFLEIGIEAPIAGSSVICKITEDAIALQEQDGVRVPFQGGTGVGAFSIFSYPIKELDKLDAKRISKERGWSEIMDLTHFCHRPKKSGGPCGRCGACKGTLAEGMGHRIPLKTRLRNRLRTVSRRKLA